MALSVHSGELRRHARVELQRRAWCEHRDWTLYLSVVNVSYAGLFIQTSTHFDSGERLRVALTERSLGPGLLIDLQVEVMWSSSRGKVPGVGCRIVDFAHGAERYAELIEQVSLATR